MLIFDMIFIDCNWLLELYKNKKGTAQEKKQYNNNRKTIQTRRMHQIETENEKPKKKKT